MWIYKPWFPDCGNLKYLPEQEPRQDGGGRTTEDSIATAGKPVQGDALS